MGLALVVWKEFIHLRRDRRALFIIIAFPAIVLILYGYVLNFDVRHVRLCIVDLDKTKESREFLSSLTSQDTFDLACVEDSVEASERRILMGDGVIAVVVPKGFGNALEVGRPIAVQALVDGSNSHSALTAIGYLEGFAKAFLLKEVQRRLERFGLLRREGPLDVRLVVYYNPTLETARFLVPGLIGIILTVMAVVSTALSLVREKERGTMKMLRVSPLHAWEIVVGKTLPYLVLALVASGLVIGVGWALFGVEVRGSIWLLLVVLLVFLLGALSLGVLISSLTDSAQVAFTLATTVSMLPSFILSGFVFPLDSMPQAIRAVSYIIPARYIIAILRAIILKGEGFETILWDFVCLLAFAFVTLMAASLKVRRAMR